MAQRCLVAVLLKDEGHLVLYDTFTGLVLWVHVSAGQSYFDTLGALIVLIFWTEHGDISLSNHLGPKHLNSSYSHVSTFQ